MVSYYNEIDPYAAQWLRNLIKAGLIGDGHDIPEIGEIIAGAKPGRGSAAEITVYRSLGISAQDLAAAHAILARADAAGVGTVVDMN